MYTAERLFVTTAKAQLRLASQAISEHLSSDRPSIHQDIKGNIRAIKKAASPVKARAIYRAALLCEDTLNRFPVTNPKFQTTLASLKSLVGLYTDGLLELDPSFKASLLGATKLNMPIINATDEEQDTVFAANENAANTLKPLLRLVRDDAPKQALSRLATYGETLYVQDGALNVTNNETAIPAPKPSLRFEALMRPITNRILGQARANEREISISYAAEFDEIEKKTATVLQAFLENICLQILKTGLPDIKTKTKRTWQISLTGSLQAQNLAIVLTWPGYTINQALTIRQSLHPVFQDFQALGGTVKSKTRKRADRDTVAGVDTGLDVQILEILCPVSAQTHAQRQPTVNTPYIPEPLVPEPLAGEA